MIKIISEKLNRNPDIRNPQKETREAVEEISGVSQRFVPGSFNPAEHQRRLRAAEKNS
jgi:hypothetical protein